MYLIIYADKWEKPKITNWKKEQSKKKLSSYEYYIYSFKNKKIILV